MKIAQKVYRFLSFLFVIFVIIPLFVTITFLFMVFNILNAFTFYNYKSESLPDEALKHLGTGLNSYGFLKFLFIVYSPIYMFWHEVKDGIKSIKY